MRSIHRAGVCLIAVHLAGLPLLAAEASSEEVFMEAMVESLESAGEKLIALARATPAEQFDWRPNDGVRTVSQVYMHVAGNNLQIPASLGAPPPLEIEIPNSAYELRLQRQRWEADFQAKDEVIAMLETSLEYALGAIPAVTGLDEVVAPYGFSTSKLDYLMIVVSHTHEHLGQSIAYARGAGIVPPWSRPPERKQVDSTAEIREGTAHVQILSIDGFGNLVTSLVDADLQALGLETGDFLTLTLGAKTVKAYIWQNPMGVGEGEWFAMLNPGGTVTIGRSYANAATTLDTEAGQPISIRPADD